MAGCKVFVTTMAFVFVGPSLANARVLPPEGSASDVASASSALDWLAAAGIQCRAADPVPDAQGGDLVAFISDPVLGPTQIWQKSARASANDPAAPRNAKAATDDQGRQPLPGAPWLRGDLQLRTLWRKDKLDWNIAGDSVKKLSELTWSGLRAHGYALAGRLDLPANFVAFGNGGWGRIRKGDHQDSDFDPVEFSRSIGDSDRGNMLDWDASLGYRFQFDKFGMQLTPLLGYAYHRQRLTMKDGVQTIADDPSDLGPFPGLNSKYAATWQGFFGGLQFGISPHARLQLRASAEYHLRTRYRGEANWNLRDDFEHPKSFTHNANGNGMTLGLDASWHMTRHWTIDLAAHYMSFDTDPGRDTVFFSPSVGGGTESTQLNKVNWSSMQFTLGATFTF